MNFENEPYLSRLPEDKTLCVYNSSSLIFSNSGKWLMPLFELEKFLKIYLGPKDNLCAHDTAVGKAAAVLMARMGIKKIHADIGSRLAERYIAELNDGVDEKEKISFSCGIKVDRLLCATEDLFESLYDSDEIYMQLRRRARLVQGVEARVENISSNYGFINDLSFTVPAGGRLMVAGENGAGKTTLLKILCGLIRPKSGEVFIDGKTPSLLPKRTIGYIPQQTDNTEFSLSVEEVVSLGIGRASVKNREAVIRRSLERTGALGLINRSYSSLSGGEKQKVSLARCLAQDAKLLLLDEPTAALDAENRKMVTDILHSLSVSEIPTIIIVTHDKELLKMHGWQTLVLERPGD
ncbi:DUF1893 domain-containing protein [Treponema parvum]|uniref:DUF1893 domain-containing protein n=1 Tax=Treponema parvum TaxID=138851 RepID=A0A975IFY5_9SPIR|nr:DUF1893 domain-containing protein [Treponema parvum]QTQ14729.1 DUF1893 domain-containing protein [Treponema parvum]